MKAALLIGMLLGFGGVLAGAHVYPWVDHERLPSRTTVVANGGRAERFVIHLPADRIHAAGAPSAGSRAAAAPAGGALPAELAASPVLAEHFKVRDVDGQVIGVAARHWSGVDGASGAAWALLIPGRGALLLSGAAEPAGRIDAALRGAGHVAGSAWSGELTVALASGDAPGRVVGGSDEFDGLVGTYSETWKITGVSADGELRGTVELDTVTQRSAAP